MVRSIRRCLLLLAVLCGGSSASLAPAPEPAEGQDPAAYLHEVRLRKLHLVRPDLIPYPVAYEVYC